MATKTSPPTEVAVVPGVEIDNEAGAAPGPAPAPAGASAPSAEQEAELATKIAAKGYAANDPRAAIFGKRMSQFERDRTELANLGEGELELGDRLAGVEPTPAGGQPQGAPAPAISDPQEEVPDESAAASPGPAPLATVPGKVKIIVDGQEREVDNDEVTRAGIAALQKLNTGDARLAQAATYEAQLRDWSRSEEARLNALAASAAQQRAPSPTPPSPGAEAPADVEGTVQKALDLLVDDKRGDAARLIAQVITRAATVAPVSPAGPQPGPAGAETRFAVTPPPVRRGPSDIEIGNRVFNEEYSDLTDQAFEVAKQLADAKLRDPANASRDIRDIVREAANTARRVSPPPAPGVTLGAPAPAAPAPVAPSPGDAAHDARRKLVARVPVAPVGASARSEPVSPAPKLPTNAEYVATLRRNNRSNSSPR